MISDFCNPRVYSAELAEGQKYQPSVTYFSISLDGEAMLVDLWNLRTSMVFKEMWNLSVKKVAEKHRPCTFASVVETWKFCNRHWAKFCEDVKTRQLTFERVDAIFGSFDKKYDVIENELALIIPKEVAVEQRKQIEQYHQLGQYSRGASTMIKLRDEFELRGDFTMAEILVDMVSTLLQHFLLTVVLP